MTKSTSLFVSGILVGVLVSTVGFSLLLQSRRGNPGDTASAGQTVLKLGHSLDTAHPVHRAIVRMRDELESLSGGKMSLDIYPGSVLGSETQCIEQLQNGSLAMTKTSAAVMENFIPEMAVFGMPYVFRDDEHYWQVLGGDIGEGLLRKGVAKFVRGLCYYEGGSRNFYTKQPIRSPEDLKGMKIRVMNSATAIEMIESFGASPTPISSGELYSALAQGIVDGAENNFPTFTSNKHYEVCKHFTLDGHTRIPDVLSISTKSWDRLSGQQQEWLSQAAAVSSDFQREIWAEETQKARDKAESEGVTVYEVDLPPFAERVRPMHDAIENENVKQILDAIGTVE